MISGYPTVAVPALPDCPPLPFSRSYFCIYVQDNYYRLKRQIKVVAIIELIKCINKMSGHLMLDEIQLSSKSFQSKPTPLIHTYKDLNSSEIDILRKYLHTLTFDLHSQPPNLQLKNQDIYKLKESITLLYKSYKNSTLTGEEIEGVWPLLTFQFTKISGLELHLAFQKLIEPISMQPNQIQPSVKEEEMEFDPKKYFQNCNNWLKDKKFLKSLRVLERTPKKKSLEQNIADCTKIFKIIILDQIEILILHRQFTEKHKQMRETILKITKERDMVKKAILQNKLFKENPLINNCIMSDLGDITNVMRYFTKEQFVNNQSYQHHELVQQTDRCKSVFQEPINKDNDQEWRKNILKQKQTSIKSSPTKRRVPSLMAPSSPTFKPRRKYGFKRQQRYKVIAKMFEFAPKQPYAQIQKQKKLKTVLKQRKQNLQKQVRKRLRKITKVQYHSDDQGNHKTKRHRPVKIKNKNKNKDKTRQNIYEQVYQIQESIDSSSQEEAFHKRQSLSESDSQQITMKKYRKPTKNINNSKFSKKFIQEIQQRKQQNDVNNFMFSDEIFEIHSAYQGDPRSNSSRVPQSSQQILQATPDFISTKQQPNLKFLKMMKPNSEGRSIEHLQNITIRCLQLDETEEIQMTINHYEYLNYLRSLQKKEIKKEIFNVAQQLLIRQYIGIDIDMTIKVLGLYIISQDAQNVNHNIWQQYKVNYIVEMLNHCIGVVLYSCFADILNNLSVSSYNENLTTLNKIKKYFMILFQISHGCYGNLQIQNMLISTIYNQMATPSRIQNFIKQGNRSHCSFINLDYPFKIGSQSLKFSLSANDYAIAYTISSFVFEQLYLIPLISNQQSFAQIRKNYLEQVAEEIKSKEATKQWRWTFSNYLNQYYHAYRPYLSQNYFISLVSLVIASLNKLMDKLLTLQERDRQVKRHTQFIMFVCEKFIDSYSQMQNVNCNTLLNILIIRTSIAKLYRDIIPQKIETMIIYPKVLTAFWKRKQLRNKQNAASKTINNYINQIYQKIKDTQTKIKDGRIHTETKPVLIEVSNPLVTESISDFVLQVYKSRLIENMYDQNQNYTLNWNKDKNNIIMLQQEESYSQLRAIIYYHYKQIDFTLNNLVNSFQKNKDKEEKSLKAIKKMQAMLLELLSKFILPNFQIRNYQTEQSALALSISHYFFGLQFVLEQNYFMKYFQMQQKLNNQLLNSLLQKCKNILEFYFQQPPNFLPILVISDPKAMVIEPPQNQDEEIELIIQKRTKSIKQHQKNEQLCHSYYKIITQHQISKGQGQSNPIVRKLQFFIINEVKDISFAPTFSNIFNMSMISLLQSSDKTKGNLIFSENPVGLYFKQSVSVHTTTPKKVQKSIYYLSSIFQQLYSYINIKQAQNRHPIANGFISASNNQIKDCLTVKFVLKYIKQIAILIIIGFALINSPQYNNIPLQNLTSCLSKIKFIKEKHLLTDYLQQGYINFLFSIQKIEKCESLHAIFAAFLFLFKNPSEKTKEGVNKMLMQIQQPLKKNLVFQSQKSHITLLSIQILTFALSWPDIKSQCIKKYLNQMQVISKGESYITKIDLTQKNIQTILRMFQAIQNNKYDYFQMKNSMNIYVDLLCDQQKNKNNQIGTYYKNIEKLLLCLSEIIKKQPILANIAMILLSKSLLKFCQPILDPMSFPRSNNLKRLYIFSQMMKLSDQERQVYQQIVIEHKQAFQKCINLIKLLPSQKQVPFSRFSSFEELIQECMIGQHSNLLNIKCFINPVMKKYILTNQQKQQFKRILSKLKNCLEKTNGNIILIEWCTEEMTKLNSNLDTNENYADWMDIQQQ